MARAYFKAYHSLLETIEPLNDAECGRLIKACLQYSKSGEVPELRGNERFIFAGLKAQIDRDADTYADTCRKNAENIKARWNTNVYDRIPPYTNDTKEEDKGKDKDIIPPSIPPQGEAMGKSSGEKLTLAEETEKLDGLGVSGELRSILERWLKYKREKRQAYTLTGLITLINTVQNKSAECGITAVVAVIDASISSNYTGITWDKVKSMGGSKISRTFGYSQRKYSDSEMREIGSDLLEREGL